MKRRLALLSLAPLLLALLLPTLAAAAAPVADDAVFVEGARYEAVLDPSAGAWRLLPATGADLQLQVSERCRAEQTPPPGLWLLSSDAAGQPELQAISSTELPAGHSGHIPLVACGDTTAGALPLPPGLVAWLQQNSGTIYVAR